MLERTSLLGGLLLSWALACGSGPATGPVEPHWNRDVCERCNMALSDRRYAAQLRDAEGQVHFFDDIGCALLWSDEQLGGEARPSEFWVRDRSGQRWIDAFRARYRPGEQTPMDFGFGAVEEAMPGDLDLDALRRSVRKSELERRDARR